MPDEVVSVDWMRDQVFLLQDRAGFTIVMTQPDGVNGADLLPLGLIGCAAWDIVSILRKQRQGLSAFRVTATSRRDEEGPWRFRQIRIRYLVQGSNINEALLKQAIALTERKYCSIYATLRDCVELVSEYEVAGSSVIPTTTVASSASAEHVVARFNDALNVADVDAMMRLMTDDCVFENTSPAPDGERYVGQAAVRRFWQEFFASSRQPHIEVEDVFAAGDRCTMLWTYSWLDEHGQAGHVRGVDVYTVRSGQIAQKLSYVKG